MNTILVKDRNGMALLWMETDANGFTTLNDANKAVPFDPAEERIEDAVEGWMESAGMERWPFVLTWEPEDLRPGDWDKWCNNHDPRLDHERVSNGDEDGIEYLSVWATSYDDARAYLESVILPAMVIEDEVW